MGRPWHSCKIDGRTEASDKRETSNDSHPTRLAFELREMYSIHRHKDERLLREKWLRSCITFRFVPPNTLNLSGLKQNSETRHHGRHALSEEGNWEDDY